RSGNLHLVYANRNGSELHYAARGKDAKTWNRALVDASGGAFNSLAIDSQGYPHVVYNPASKTGLHYAKWDGKQWQRYVIDPAHPGHQTAIRLDSKDHPRISYHIEDYSNRRSARNLKYAYFDGDNWFIQTVDYRNGTGTWNSIAVDGSDHAFISFSITGPGSMGLAHQEATGWEYALVAGQERSAREHAYGASSLAFDGSGQPVLAYIDSSARTVNYAHFESGSWKHEVVDYLVSAGADTDRVS